MIEPFSGVLLGTNNITSAYVSQKYKNIPDFIDTALVVVREMHTVTAIDIATRLPLYVTIFLFRNT